jgi:hypothetical protein
MKMLKIILFFFLAYALLTILQSLLEFLWFRHYGSDVGPFWGLIGIVASLVLAIYFTWQMTAKGKFDRKRKSSS